MISEKENICLHIWKDSQETEKRSRGLRKILAPIGAMLGRYNSDKSFWPKGLEERARAKMKDTKSEGKFWKESQGPGTLKSMYKFSWNPWLTSKPGKHKEDFMHPS